MSVPELPHLLPDNAPPFLRDLAGLSRHLGAVDPSAIETLWDAWRCPSALLPWLAWALSVDVWNDGWSEVVQRQAIADSPDYHRRKGTVRAVRAALALGGRPFELTEWFDFLPAARRGTSTVFVEASLAEIGTVLRAIRPLVMAAKPKSRPIVLGAGERVAGTISISAGLLAETLTVVDPYAYGGEELEAPLLVAAGLLSETLNTIEAMP